ncbi:5-hydroxytryptamine receptor 1D-like [Diadema setosum]|uniref:5-hydroxytryptamine receptor 1D-like n=1 Tax=Diadema setosum TaxID=31175 RepID=UPI003B3BD7DC
MIPHTQDSPMRCFNVSVIAQQSVPLHAEANSTKGSATDPDQWYTVRMSLAVVISLISAGGVLGNVLVIASVCLSRKLRTVTNVFVTNLSITDLITCLTMPVQVAALLDDSYFGSALPKSLCVLVGGSNYTLTATSVFTLVLIAFNRWSLVTRSKSMYVKTFTPRRNAFFLSFVWISPIVIMIIVDRSGLSKAGYSSMYRLCTLNIAKYGIAGYAQAGGLAVLCFLVIAVFYALIYRHVSKRKRRLHSCNGSRVSSVQNLESCESDSSVARLPKIMTKTQRAETRVTINMFIIVCAFLVCIVPFSISILIPVRRHAYIYTFIPLFLNSAINPLIYANMHPIFRHVFVCLLQGKYNEIPEPSSLLRRLCLTSKGGLY